MVDNVYIQETATDRVHTSRLAESRRRKHSDVEIHTKLCYESHRRNQGNRVRSQSQSHNLIIHSGVCSKYLISMEAIRTFWTGFC